MMKLPAGLLDNNLEFFNDPKNIEICYALTGGHVFRVNELPFPIIHLIDLDMKAHPEKLEALVAIGYETEEAQREKYCSCCFGGFDGEPDVLDGKFLHAEYWPCPSRLNCPVEAKLCNALEISPGKYLTKRELQVFKLIYLPEKEIADQLGISVETVKIHKKHISEKTGLFKNTELVHLACKRNLI